MANVQKHPSPPGELVQKLPFFIAESKIRTTETPGVRELKKHYFYLTSLPRRISTETSYNTLFILKF